MTIFSDHFPIIVEGNDPVKIDCIENWKLNKADWTLFKNLCLQNILTEEFGNEMDPVQKFTDSSIHIASKCILKTPTSSKRIKSHGLLKIANKRLKPGKKQNDSLTKHQRCVNLNNFRIARAKARRTINQSKLKPWKDYVSNLNMHTLINKV